MYVEQRCLRAGRRCDMASEIANKHHKYHGAEQDGYSHRVEFPTDDGTWGWFCGASEGEGQVILLLDSVGIRAGSQCGMGRSRGSQAACRGQSRDQRLVRATGLEPEPCTPAAGYGIRCCGQAANVEGTKSKWVTHGEKFFPSSSGVVKSQLLPQMGTGNKKKHLAGAVLLAEHVTPNYFRPWKWCGLITGGTFWL